jgi:Skp family chaperone for outer membrane proteins
MSVLQELQNIKTGLEEESHSLNEERKTLEDKVTILREKLAIEHLRKNNQVTKDVIAQLKAEISELEQRLNKTIETPAPSQQCQEVIAEEVSVMEPEAPVAQQQSDENKQEERKRRFF